MLVAALEPRSLLSVTDQSIERDVSAPSTVGSAFDANEHVTLSSAAW
jgi:hypothetical protein